jgi:hypothetical protein
LYEGTKQSIPESSEEEARARRVQEEAQNGTPLFPAVESTNNSSNSQTLDTAPA